MHYICEPRGAEQQSEHDLTSEFTEIINCDASTKHFNLVGNRLLGNVEDLAALHTSHAQFDRFKLIFCLR